MAKRNVKFLKGKYFHIYNRGASRKKIFFEADNYVYLLKRLKNYVNKCEFTVIAYCLMPNHYHFVLRQDGDIPLNVPIAFLFNGYTKAINKRYNRTGTLFEGPFKAIEIEEVNYLLELCRYIHRNPVDDGLVEKIDDWVFSNYLEWIGKRNGTLIDSKLRNKYFLDVSKYESYVVNYKSIKRAIKGMRKYLLELEKSKKKK